MGTNPSAIERMVRERQRHLLKPHAGDEEVPAPFSVETLVADLSKAVAVVDQERECALHRRLLIDTVLVAELVSSTMCPDTRQAGGIYPAIKPSKDPDWHEVHEPMRVLRNAMLHPGAIVPDAGNDTPHLGSVVDRLYLQMNGNSETQALAALLYQSPARLFRIEFVQWAIEQLDGIGRYDAERTGQPL
ncbi:MAG: hypothetical protein IT382_15515 [Deltaproteobacteria bacterium]|nr:hypothetical protein [Deltaproteobacteria bacterium]